MGIFLAALAGVLAPVIAILGIPALILFLPEREEKLDEPKPWETPAAGAPPVYQRPVEPVQRPEPAPAPQPPRDPRDLGEDSDFDDSIFGG